MLGERASAASSRIRCRDDSWGRGPWLPSSVRTAPRVLVLLLAGGSVTVDGLLFMRNTMAIMLLVLAAGCESEKQRHEQRLNDRLPLAVAAAQLQADRTDFDKALAILDGFEEDIFAANLDMSDAQMEIQLVRAEILRAKEKHERIAARRDVESAGKSARQGNQNSVPVAGTDQTQLVDPRAHHGVLVPRTPEQVRREARLAREAWEAEARSSQAVNSGNGRRTTPRSAGSAIVVQSDPFNVRVRIGQEGLASFATMTNRFTGPSMHSSPPRARHDLDRDGDLDLADFALLQRAFGLVKARMVRIRGGTFVMGRHVGAGEADELPLQSARLGPFWMDVYEVTNAQYCEYLRNAYADHEIEVRPRDRQRVFAMGGHKPYCATGGTIRFDGETFSVIDGKENHPVSCVSWHGAAAYANWRSSQEGRLPCYEVATGGCSYRATGYRLPTEAEWEYAARGGKHRPYCRYPWGDHCDGSNANYWKSKDPLEADASFGTTPVAYYNGGQTPSGTDMVNGYGLYDMAGNVREWCNDWYKRYDENFNKYRHRRRVARGGSHTSGLGELRCASRRSFDPTSCDGIGFRLVRN